MNTQITPNINIYRYSVRTLAGYGVYFGFFLIVESFLFAISVKQYYNRPDTSILLPAFFILPALLCVGLMIVWLRNRPTLHTSEDGVWVEKFFSGRTFLKWCDLKRVDDFHRVTIQTGRRVRYFIMRWEDSTVRFNQYYNDLPSLILKLNEQIQKFHVSVFVHEFAPLMLQSELESTSSSQERRNLKKDGIVTEVRQLQV